MAELVTRLGAVISSYDATAVVSALASAPECGIGTWRMSTNRWELWSAGDGQESRLLGAVDVAHDLPHAFAATLTRAELSGAALAAGITPEALCDAALAAIGTRLADCPRTHAAPPPLFTNQRRTDRGAWLAEQRAEARDSVPAAAVTPAPVTVPSSAPAQTLPAETPPALDAAEDRELRRLHYLATFGGLTGGLAGRYAELRARDRRDGVRDPQDDELVILPRPRAARHDDAVPAVLWESAG